jgi:putative membrane protein
VKKLELTQYIDKTILMLTFFFLIVYLLMLVKVGQLNRMIVKKIIRFILGLVLINLCFGSVLNFYSHLLFSVHMFQMSLLCFFIPVLILSGLPEIKEYPRFRLFAKLRSSKNFRHAILGLFAFMFSFYHFPFVFNIVMSHKGLHDFSKGLLMVLSFLVWWPVTTSSYDDEKSNKLKRNYIYKMLILLMPACLLPIISNSGLYKVYSDPIFLRETLQVCFSPDIDVKQNFIKFHFLSTIGDQRLGGTIMIISHKLASYWLLRHKDSHSLEARVLVEQKTAPHSPSRMPSI